MSINSKITPCLWFGGSAKEAAEYYTSVFPNSSIKNVEHYTSAGQEHHKMAVGSVMHVQFDLNGSPFSALNGPPLFNFNQAVSFVIQCEDQAEVDHYWAGLGDGGEPGPCGWMKDKFGLSWQVVPRQLEELLKAGNGKQKTAVSAAMMKMKKLDVAGLQQAFDGAA